MKMKRTQGKNLGYISIQASLSTVASINICQHSKLGDVKWLYYTYLGNSSLLVKMACNGKIWSLDIASHRYTCLYRLKHFIYMYLYFNFVLIVHCLKDPKRVSLV